MDPDEIAQELGTSGRCVCADFLTPALCVEVREDLDRVAREGGFGRAGTGQGSGQLVRNQVRRDDIHWLAEDAANPAQQQLWRKVDTLKQAFNRTLYLGLSTFEGHYVAYPVDGFYKRHRDSFQQDDARMVTVIVYLNRDWHSDDGGRLRVYENGGHVDIDPLGGTLVCFLSRELEHEVLLSHAARFSFAGWFKTRQQPPGLVDARDRP